MWMKCAGVVDSLQFTVKFCILQVLICKFKVFMPNYILSIFFVIYLLCTGALAERVLYVFFHFERSFRSKLFAILANLISLSWLGAIAIIFFTINTTTLAIIFLLNLILCGTAYWLAKKNDTDMRAPEGFFSSLISFEKPNSLSSLGVILYIIIAAIGFYLLSVSRTGTTITTPWLTINSSYIYVFAVATFLLGILIFARVKTSTLLFLLFIHAFLLHSYLPATHQLVYGADAWRHIAIEEQIVAGETLPEVKITDASVTTDLVSSIGKLSYSQFWAFVAIFQRFTGISLLTLFAWLQPLLWALFVPLLLYEIAQSIGWNEQISLFFAWLGFLPYTWQVGGSFTLPVTVGFVMWLFLVLLLLKRMANPEPLQLLFLLPIGILSLFGYALYFILFWIAFFTMELVRLKDHFSTLLIVIFVLLVSAIFPVIEWKAGFSTWPSAQPVLESVKQFVGNFSAFYLATGPRPHAISTGNIIFNQVPSYAYVANIFTIMRWWVVVFMLGFFGFVFFGWYRAVVDGCKGIPDVNNLNLENQNQQRRAYVWLLVFGSALFLSYFISRYFFGGEHSLTRRFDIVIALVLLLFVGIAINFWSKKLFSSNVGIIFILITTIAIATSYSLGPDTNAVSIDEYDAMSYIWQQDKNLTNHCIIANVYPLLALEAISGKNIVGGGFPIDHNFAQPELTDIVGRSGNDDIGVTQARKGLTVTRSDHCWLVMPSSITVSYFIKETGAPVTHFNSVDVWRFGKQ